MSLPAEQPKTSRWFVIAIGLAVVTVAGVAALLQTRGIGDATVCGPAAAPGVDWSGCRAEQIKLTNADLTDARLANVDFSRGEFDGTTLQGADLTRAVLSRGDFTGALLARAKFERAEALRADFTGVNAEWANFSKAELARSRWKNARLLGADFTKSDLQRADLTGADLTNATFAQAVLARTDLRGATLTGADFGEAYLLQLNIEGSDLSQSRGLTQAQIDLTCGNGATKLPAGLDAPSTWPCPPDSE